MRRLIVALLGVMVALAIAVTALADSGINPQCVTPTKVVKTCPPKDTPTTVSTPTAANTPTSIPTDTPVPTATQVAPTDTPVPTKVLTSTSIASATIEVTPTNTPVATIEVTVTPKATSTTTAAPSSTPVETVVVPPETPEATPIIEVTPTTSTGCGIKVEIVLSGCLLEGTTIVKEYEDNTGWHQDWTVPWSGEKIDVDLRPGLHYRLRLWSPAGDGPVIADFVAPSCGVIPVSYDSPCQTQQLPMVLPVTGSNNTPWGIVILLGAVVLVMGMVVHHRTND